MDAQLAYFNMSERRFNDGRERNRSSSAKELSIQSSYGHKLSTRMDIDKDSGGSGDGTSNTSALSMSPSFEDTPELTNYDLDTKEGELTVKVICLGDSAVGKSK